MYSRPTQKCVYSVVEFFYSLNNCTSIVNLAQPAVAILYLVTFMPTEQIRKRERERATYGCEMRRGNAQPPTGQYTVHTLSLSLSLPSSCSLSSLTHAHSPSHAESRFCHERSRDSHPPSLSPREREREGKRKSGCCLDSIKQNARQMNTSPCQLK